MEDLKKKVEALLFSSGRRMSEAELSKICRKSPAELHAMLLDLKQDYDGKPSSLIVQQDGDYWKLTTKDDYLNVVKNIVTKTELNKTLMETLAVIAFKYPIKQADLIKIRTNKAYDHLKELEGMGYISRQKYGRTKLIKLAPKFFDYFSLPEGKLKEQFKDFEGLAEAIEDKESEIRKLSQPPKEVDLIDAKGNPVQLEVVDEPPEEKLPEQNPPVETYTDSLGSLEVIDEPEIQEPSQKQEEPKGIAITEEQEDEVDKRVDEILGLKKEQTADESAETPIVEDEPPAESSEEPATSDVDKEVEAMLHPKKEEEPESDIEIDKTKWGKSEEEESEEPLDADKKDSE